jgi:hypothetical protein
MLYAGAPHIWIEDRRIYGLNLRDQICGAPQSRERTFLLNMEFPQHAPTKLIGNTYSYITHATALFSPVERQMIDVVFINQAK